MLTFLFDMMEKVYDQDYFAIMITFNDVEKMSVTTKQLTTAPQFFWW